MNRKQTRYHQQSLEHLAILLDGPIPTDEPGLICWLSEVRFHARVVSRSDPEWKPVVALLHQHISELRAGRGDALPVVPEDCDSTLLARLAAILKPLGRGS